MMMPARALGQTDSSTPETSLPWYQQFWDELWSPFSTNVAVAQQQTEAAVGDVSTGVSTVGWLLVGVLGIVVITMYKSK